MAQIKLVTPDPDSDFVVVTLSNKEAEKLYDILDATSGLYDLYVALGALLGRE